MKDNEFYKAGEFQSQPGDDRATLEEKEKDRDSGLHRVRSCDSEYEHKDIEGPETPERDRIWTRKILRMFSGAVAVAAVTAAVSIMPAVQALPQETSPSVPVYSEAEETGAEQDDENPQNSKPENTTANGNISLVMASEEDIKVFRKMADQYIHRILHGAEDYAEREFARFMDGPRPWGSGSPSEEDLKAWYEANDKNLMQAYDSFAAQWTGPEKLYPVEGTEHNTAPGVCRVLKNCEMKVRELNRAVGPDGITGYTYSIYSSITRIITDPSELESETAKALLGQQKMAVEIICSVEGRVIYIADIDSEWDEDDAELISQEKVLIRMVFTKIGDTYYFVEDSVLS